MVHLHPGFWLSVLAVLVFLPASHSRYQSINEVDAFPYSEVLSEQSDTAEQRTHNVDVIAVDIYDRRRLYDGSSDDELPPIIKLKHRHSEVEGPLKLKVDDKNGLVQENSGNQTSLTRSPVPKLCLEGVPCQKVDSRVRPPTYRSTWDGRRMKRSPKGHMMHRSSLCEREADIEAWGSNYTLCLFLKEFKHESILASSWEGLNVTIFGVRNTSEDVGISQFSLKYAAGYVVDEDFTSASGFLMDDHFYGTVYMRDAVHYLEPHNRKSRDMHIFGDGLKTLLHKHDVKDSREMKASLPGWGSSPGNSKAPTRRMCDLTIVADHLFYDEVGEGSVEKTLLQMLWHIKEANALFQSEDFDDDGLSECLGFTVSEITIFKSPDSAVNLLTGEYEVPEDFLKRFSRYNFDGFCLGILFTDRAFSELVLGLSWRGNPKPSGVGGICQSRVRIKSDRNAYSFNALFISLRSSQEERIPLRMGVLNLVHEMMHSFGAKHDPDAAQSAQCTPDDKWVNGRYLMSKYSNDGHKLNHEILSPCTRSLVRKNLDSETRVACLIKVDSPFCGDGIVQEGEDCDCGTIFQCIAARSCCAPPEGIGSKTPCTIQRDLTACVL